MDAAKPTETFVESASPAEVDEKHEDISTPPSELEPQPVSASTILAVFFMGLSYAPAIGTGFVMPAQIIQQIGMSLGDTQNIAWIPGGWSIGSAISFAIAGGLSDIFGRRWILIFGQFLVLVGAIIGCVAQSTLTVAAGSTCIGFGAGVVFVSYPGISELLPNKYRGIGLAWTEFCITVPWGAISGLLATQLYLHASWRWCYYITIIYSVICIAGTFFSYFPPSRPQHDYERSRWDEFKSLDFVGLGLFATGMAVFLVGITYLGRSDYSVPFVASTITVGAVVFIASFVYDFTVPKSPIFPLKLFRMTREFTIHLLILFISGMIWQSILALGNQGTLFMFTNDIVQIGIISIPASMSGVIGGWLLPGLVHKIKHVRIQIMFALLLQTVFTASYAAVVPHNKTAWTILPMFGQTCFTWVTMLAYVSSGLFVPQEELGISAGLMGTFRSAGGSVGNAIFSTILTSNINRNLAKNIIGAALAAGFPQANLKQLVPAVIQNAVGNPTAFAQVPDLTQPVIDATTAAFKNTYAHAFRLVFYAMVPFGATALVAAWFVRDPSHLLNDKVAVQQEKLVLGPRKQKDPHEMKVVA